MEPDIPEHHPDGSISALVAAPDGARYEVHVWPVENYTELPVRGLRGLFWRLGRGSLAEGQHRFRATVSPAGGGPIVAAKVLTDRTVGDALLGCAGMVSGSGLDDFDQVDFKYGGWPF